MKTRILTLFLIFAGTFAFAQQPEWHFPEAVSGFDSNASWFVNVSINGELQTDVDRFEIAAFIGDQVRSREFYQRFPDGHDYACMTIMALSDETRTITFKLYDHSTNQEFEGICLEDTPYVPNAIIGGPVHPFTLHFVTPTTCTFTNVSGNNWSTAANWDPSYPTEYDDVVIAANCTIDVNATVLSTTLNTAKNITINENLRFDSPEITVNGSKVASRITLLNNAQLITNSTPKHTVKKDITAYAGTRDNYYFISSPIGNIATTSVTGLLNEDFDLYSFSGWYPEEEWNNYIDEENNYWESQMLEDKKGYLYANSSDVTLAFGGAYNNAVSVTKNELDFAEGEDLEEFPWACFNLLGNPYSKNASVSGSDISGYYVINTENNRSNIIASVDPIVAPCTGLMAVTTSYEATVTFTPSTTAATVRGNNHINIEVNNAEGNLMDRAYVRMNENSMVKFNLNSDATKLYFRQNNKDYAIASAVRDTHLPLYFETREYGIYTINVKLENMSCEYLHLIDNLTGMDIDLNATPSYTFRANQGDYACRFKLVFEGTGVEENNAIENFAIVEGNRVIIPMIEHESTLEIIDMTGRTVSSQKVNGSFDQTLNVNAGIYLLRMNGKVQKIVVR